MVVESGIPLSIPTRVRAAAAAAQALAFDTDFRIDRYGPHKTQAFTVHP